MNPFAKKATFDQQLGECAKALSAYPAEQLRNCTYGTEADQLRATSRDEIGKLFTEYGMETKDRVWAAVDGSVVQDSSTEKGNETSRAPWQNKLVKAVCNVLAAPIPVACSKFLVV